MCVTLTDAFDKCIRLYEPVCKLCSQQYTVCSLAFAVFPSFLSPLFGFLRATPSTILASGMHVFVADHVVMKLRKTRRRLSLLGIVFLVLLSYVLVIRPPKSILSHIPRDFVSTAPYVPPTSLPPPFTVPQILAAHCRQECAIISLFTSGIDMTVSQRNLSAVACRIGNYVVPALSFKYDVLHCPANRLKPGDVLAPVLLRDKNLRRALQGPVTLATGVIAKLHERDLLPLRELSVHPSLSSKDLALVPSDHTYLPSPSPRAQRWQVCLMTQIKPATYLLPNWVDYHRRIGVDHVYIFDNGAAEDIASMFVGREDVEVIRWPYHKSQPQLIGYFLQASQGICEHVLHMDSDEFYMFGLGNRREFLEEPPLPRYLRRAKEKQFHNFRLPYIVMGNSGYRLRPPGPVPENFLHRAEMQFNNGKPVCSTDLDYESGRVHACGFVNGKPVPLYLPRFKEFGDINIYPTKLDDIGFVVHFRQRSWEEWIERMNAGWVAGKLVNDANKDNLDIDDPDARFMAYNESMRYTHFRDVYRRVVQEGSLDRAFTVRHDVNGSRCIREVSVFRQILPPAVERCWDA